jgi:hypothetical protein
VVFGEGDDAGLLVSVPPPGSAVIADDAEEPDGGMAQIPLGSDVLTPYDERLRGGVSSQRRDLRSRTATAGGHVRATGAGPLVLSTVGRLERADRLWPDVLAVVRARGSRSTARATC